jgi:hypothetical protein
MFGSCCCTGASPTGGGCQNFAARVLDPACPPRVQIEGDFTFEVFIAGGSSRGCLGMPTARPLWGTLKRGTIHVTSVLHRVQCNGNTPWLNLYKIQTSCTGGLACDDPDWPLLCDHNCSSYATGCRTYIARENPCGSPPNITSLIADEIGTEITTSMLMGLPVQSERRMPCTGVGYFTCSHFQGSDGYTNLPATGTTQAIGGGRLYEDAIEKTPPGTLGVAATGGPVAFSDCPTCFGLDKPVFGVPGTASCTGTARCTSKIVTCSDCSFTPIVTGITPHLRAAVTGITCYTVKDAYNNCVEAWIHIPPPELFSGPWRAGVDPYIPTGIKNIFPSPAEQTAYYPKLLSALAFDAPRNASMYDNSEGIGKAEFLYPSGVKAYYFPFTWGRKITNVPECIPSGDYVMFGSMGSGLTPTVYNRCLATCTGTNNLGQTRTYYSTEEDYTQPFLACTGYFVRTAPFETCYEMYYATGNGFTGAGYGDGSFPQLGVTCNDPWCCCRPATTWTWFKDEFGQCQENWSGYPVISGPRDPRICRTYNAKPFPGYTKIEELTEYYRNNFPRNNCNWGMGGKFVVRDRNIPLWTCTGFTCCSPTGACNTWFDPELVGVPGMDVPCGGLSYRSESDLLYSCQNPTGGPANHKACGIGTCMYNVQPHGYTTHMYVHMLREFPASLQLTWLT